MVVGDVTQLPIKAGPALSPDLALQRRPDLAFAARSKFQGDPLLGPAAQTLPHIIAGDDQIAAVVGAAADQHMDVRIVGVPVVDGDPVERCAEIALGVGHQLAGEGAQVLHLAGVLRRDDEAEMMPVVLAARCEGVAVGLVAARIEHPRRRAITGDALAFEVGDMAGDRRGAELGAGMTHDPHLDDHAPRLRPSPPPERGSLPAAKASPAA